MKFCRIGTVYDMKHIFLFYVLFVALLLSACNNVSREQMLGQLEELERHNNADSLMQNDSLAETLVAYFDRYGTSNERLCARYILGRTYADLGEAPAALETYLDAAAYADTTSADCDYMILSRVYGQSALIFYKQNLMDNCLHHLEQAVNYAWNAKDTFQALNSSAFLVAVYDRLERFKDAVSLFDSIYHQYKRYYSIEEAAKYCIMPIRAMLMTNQLEKARQCLEVYEAKSGYVDAEGNVERGREAFYYSKGLYYLHSHQLDSAEYFFRKELHYGKDLTNQSMASRGLSLTFEQKHIPDSAAKYAIYSYEANDSVYTQMATREVEQAKAMYDYSRNRLLAEEKSSEASQARNILVLVSTVALVFIIVLLFVFIIYRRTQRQKVAQYRQLLESLEKEQTELMELRTMEETSISSVLERKDKIITDLQHQVAVFQKRNISDNTLLEKNLEESPIVRKLRQYLRENPPREASFEDIRQLKNLINENIPSFYDKLKELRSVEYEICLLIRTHFAPAEISKLLRKRNDYVTTTRKRILYKIYNIEGVGKDLDALILNIR